MGPWTWGVHSLYEQTSKRIRNISTLCLMFFSVNFVHFVHFVVVFRSIFSNLRIPSKVFCPCFTLSIFSNSRIQRPYFLVRSFVSLSYLNGLWSGHQNDFSCCTAVRSPASRSSDQCLRFSFCCGVLWLFCVQFG